ncbi:MAG: hypothetical protein J6586_03630, partial [Snodgrassella sp.]|nr:hypothetical protein [Snodgrassella sp.]
MPTLFHLFIKQFCYPVSSHCLGYHHMFSPNSSRISDWARMREILTILAKHGLGEFLVRIKLPIRRIKHSDPSAQHQRYLSTPRRF